MSKPERVVDFYTLGLFYFCLLNDFISVIKTHWSAHDDIRKLQTIKASVQQLSDDTGQVIKRNVFENYSQFIKTAKDVIC